MCRFLRCFLVGLLLLVLSSWSSFAATMDDFVGVNLRYQIGFLWMDHIADGSFIVERDGDADIYRARLVGKTRGFAAWLTKDRVQSYETRMRRLPNGRLQTLTHESLIDKGSGKKRKRRSKYYQFDPQASQVLIEKRGNGGQVMWNKQVAIEEELFPVDILTAFFNFATGVYGPFEQGRVYEVPAFSGEGVGLIRIDVVPSSQAPGSLFDKNILICRVQVDQEVFDTQDGILYVQFDESMRPVRGIVKDIIGMGDIRGMVR